MGRVTEIRSQLVGDNHQKKSLLSKHSSLANTVVSPYCWYCYVSLVTTDQLWSENMNGKVQKYSLFWNYSTQQHTEVSLCPVWDMNPLPVQCIHPV